MTMQLSFYYNDVQYVTIFDAVEFLRQVEVFKNVAQVSDINMSAGLLQTFRKLSGVNTRDVPIVETDTIDVDGDIIRVTGSVVIDGLERRVSIDEFGCHFDVDLENVKDLRVEEENDDFVIVEGEDENNEEPEELVEPEGTEEEEEEEEEEVKEEVEEVEEEEAVKSKIEETAEIHLEDVQVEDIENTEKEVVEEGNKEASLSSWDASQRFKPFSKLTGKPIPTNGGFAMDGSHSISPREEFVVGSKTNNDKGFYFGSKPYEKNIVRLSAKTNQERKTAESNKHKQNKKPVVKEQKTPIKPKSYVPKQEVEEKVEDVLESTGFKNNKLETKESVESQIKEKGIVTSNKEEIKDELTEALSRVPISLLGGIEAFTNRPINIKQLREQGRMYCVQNNWCRSGNWFCIDMVAELNRYFYNCDTHEAFAIPVNVCKEFANVTEV